jgi:hypothetical protein
MNTAKQAFLEKVAALAAVGDSIGVVGTVREAVGNPDHPANAAAIEFCEELVNNSPALSKPHIMIVVANGVQIQFSVRFTSLKSGAIEYTASSQNLDDLPPGVRETALQILDDMVQATGRAGLANGDTQPPPAAQPPPAPAAG